MRRLRERILAGDGVRLRGLELAADPAAPAARPLLLVHATSFCADVFGPVLASASHPGAALAIDQRGHGGSDAPEDPAAYHWTRLAADVVAAAAQLDPAPILVGHSSGASACLAAAGMAPSLTAGVALVEPVLFDFPVASGADSFAGSRALAERARKRRAVYPSRAAARESLSGRFPYSGFAPECLDAWLEGGLGPHPDGVALRCAPEREAWAYEGAAALDLWPWAERVRSPVVLLIAEHSAVPARLADRLAAALPRCDAVRIPGATHFAALERPAEVGSALHAFAAGLAP